MLFSLDSDCYSSPLNLVHITLNISSSCNISESLPAFRYDFKKNAMHHFLTLNFDKTVGNYF